MTAKFSIMVDPATIATPQQKRYSMVAGRIRTFAHPKVARGMRVVQFMATNAIRKVNAVMPPFYKPVKLDILFLYAVPKTRRNRTVRGEPPPCEGEPCTAHWAADCDNRAKLVIDALTKCRCWNDDKDVTDLHVRKVWTYGPPHIEAEISEDGLTVAADGGNTADR